MLVLEFGLSVDGISAATNNGRIQLLETAHRVAKLGRFVRSTWCVGFGKEIEDEVLAAKIGKGNRAAIVSRGPERGCLVAFLEHLFVSDHTGITQANDAGFHSRVED